MLLYKSTVFDRDLVFFYLIVTLKCKRYKVSKYPHLMETSLPSPNISTFSRRLESVQEFRCISLIIVCRVRIDPKHSIYRFETLPRE